MALTGSQVVKKRPRLILADMMRFDFVRIFLGLVLLGAAFSKGFQLATETVPGTSLLTSRGFLIAVVLFEMGFGLWLFFGLYRRWTWFAAIALFFLFLEVSFWQVLQGEKSCRCLGKLHVHPLLTLVFDLGAILALLFSFPGWSNGPALRTCPRRLWVFSTFFSLLAIPAVLSMAFYSPRGLFLDLRKEKLLQATLDQELKAPKTDDILHHLQQTTGLSFALDGRLKARQPDWGYWSLGTAWSVMIRLAEKQPVPARWEKVGDGYILTQAAPWGNRLLPWLASGVLLGMVIIGFGIKRVFPKSTFFAFWR